MKNLLQIRDQQQNRRITLILWLLLGSMSMGIMLWTAAHKTVVISALSQEQGGLVTENQAERSHEMQLAMAEDRKAEREICIPLETGTKAENVVVENHYMERELWIYVQNGRKSFYREHQLTGDFSLVGNGICEAQNEGVLLRLSMKEILEYHSTLEEGTLKIDFVNPRESYDRIVVLDPVGGGRDRGVADSGCEEKNIALEVARQTAQLLEGSMVKIYLTRTEDTEVAQEVRRSFADWVDADLYLEIGLSADDAQESTYGIRAEYNDEYYLPDFGNVQWADCVTRQVTVASSNRAIGLFPAEEDDILWQLKIPAARISLGYVTEVEGIGRTYAIQNTTDSCWNRKAIKKSWRKVLQKLFPRFILIRNDDYIRTQMRQGVNMQGRIVFATGNAGKIKEIRMIMEDTGLEVVSMKDAGIKADIEENGKTYEENALIKARAVAAFTKDIVMADDSGLEIDALNKEPGIYSARYLGEDTPYSIKNANLIQRLEGVPEEKRTARFVCAIAAVLPDGRELTTRATIEGRIGYEEKGTNGFGYDPIFYVPEFGKTTAELTEEEKNQVSHRGKALELMKEELKKYEDTDRK